MSAPGMRPYHLPSSPGAAGSTTPAYQQSAGRVSFSTVRGGIAPGGRAFRLRLVEVADEWKDF